ncbi:hypothetical protein BH11PSE2_BH11PSE2_10290 [soil metagenome]
MAQTWKKGRGKLGVLDPLIGDWRAEEADPKRPQGYCERRFERVLGGNYVQLSAKWVFSYGGKENVYQETALFGPGEGGGLAFWSFTSDGKRSQGQSAAAPDVAPDPICFEAQMPQGLARMVYWPAEDEGFHFAVESKTKKGWNRFLNHHYRPAGASRA